MFDFLGIYKFCTCNYNVKLSKRYSWMPLHYAIFGLTGKKMILQNSFKQIYVFKRDKAEIEKKPRTRPYFTKCTVTVI